MESKIRQNLHEESEGGLNRLINWTLYASYTYLSMAAYYDRDDVASAGFRAYFKSVSQEKYKHACKLIEYQNKRGGRVVFKQIDKPSKDEWGSGSDGLAAALDMEKNVNQLFLDLYKCANKHNDPHLGYLIEEEFLEEQTKRLKLVGDYIQQIKRAGSGLGEWHFDKMLLKEYS